MGSERQADAERKAGEVIAEKIATHHARTLERQHMADIGGIMWSATSREIFEEGLQIPRMKLFEGGVPNETAFAFIRQNVRKPDIVEGDLYAMLAAAEVVERRLNEFLAPFGDGGSRLESPTSRLRTQLPSGLHNLFEERLLNEPFRQRNKFLVSG